jgi:hypothetical protein
VTSRLEPEPLRSAVSFFALHLGFLFFFWPIFARVRISFDEQIAQGERLEAE